MGTTTSPERLIVTNYAEGVRDLLVNISAVDYYKNVVASTSTRVQISVDSSQESCLFNTDSAGIFGSLTAYTVAGVATVTNFGARCAPGGTLNVSITSTVVKAPAAFPHYSLRTAAEELALQAETRDIYSSFQAFLPPLRYR